MRRLFFPLLALAAALSVFAPAGAGAATINVSTTADDYGANPTCSLREAIESSNTETAFGGCSTGVDNDQIVLPAGTYTVTGGAGEDANASGDLDVTDPHNTEIVGTGIVTIRSSGSDRVFHHFFGGGDLTLRNVTISNGSVPGIDDGGGILNVVGILHMRSSTVRGNIAPISGGGIANYDMADLRNVTVSGNSSYGSGGGIYSTGPSLLMNNVTVAYNTADVNADGSGDGGGIAGSGDFTISNTILGNNFDRSPAAGDKAPDCATLGGLSARFTLLEVFDPADCLGFMPATNITGQDPLLETLARNGGNTANHALREGSPAIDTGGSSGADVCEDNDQRGINRPQRAGCDIGAFEATRALPNVRCNGLRATIVGNNRRNVLVGTPRRDVIVGRGGSDLIRGLRGDDFLCGGDGRDRIIGGKGRDIIEGQGAGDGLFGGDGSDRLRGGASRDRIFGGAGRDRLIGGPGPDLMVGGPGGDDERQ